MRSVGEPSRSRCSRRALPVSISSAQSIARGGQAIALRRRNAPFTVGRGPVPRHRSCTRNPTRAGACPPRYEKITPAFHRRAVGKPVPRQRPRARPCKSGSPDSDPFVIRRAQTTAGETHIVTMDNTGDRPRTTGTSRPGGLSYGNIASIKTGTARRQEKIETRRSPLPGKTSYETP